MRRQDRAIEDKKEIFEIMKECHVCSLAFSGEEYPYVVPVNFGADLEEDRITLYFHGAGSGTKIERMKADDRVSFCMYTGEELVIKTPACRSTMLYTSVCGKGRLSFVENSEEKKKGLDILMRQYDKESESFAYDDGLLNRMAILKLTVEQATGKSNRPRQS